MKTNLIYTIVILLSSSSLFGQEVRLAVQTGHSGTINQIIYNNDESLLASASTDNNIAIWHLTSGKQFISLNGHESSVTGIAFHPNKNIIYSSSLDSTLRIWDVQSGELIDKVSFDSPIGCMSINKEGKLLALGGKYLSIYDLDKKELNKKQIVSEQIFTTINFSPTGNLIAFGSKNDNSTYIVNLKTNELIGQFTAKSNDLKFDKDEKYLFSATENAGLIRYDINQNKTEGVTNKSEWNSFNTVDITNRFLIGGTDKGEVVIFNRNSYKKEIILKAHLGSVKCIAIDEDGEKMMTGGADKRIIEWDLNRQELVQSLQANIYRINQIAFSDNEDDIIIGFSNGFVRTTNLVTNTSTSNRAKLGQHQILNGWEYLLTSIEKTKESETVFNMYLLRKSLMVNGAFDYVKSVDMSWNTLNNSVRLNETDNESSKIRNYEKSLRRNQVLPKTYFLESGHLTQNSGNYFVKATDQTLSIKNKDKQSSEFEVEINHTDKVTSIAINEKYGFVATSSWDGMIKFWSLENGDLLGTFGAFGSNDFVYLRPDNYYYSSKGALESIGFAIDDQLFAFDQFDLIYNRPDLVFENLPFISEETVNNYEKAYKKRLSKLGLNEADLKITTELPEISVENKTGSITNHGNVNVFITAKDSTVDLKSLHILVNGVPIYTRDGKKIDSSYVEIKEKIDINPGKNIIQIYVTNELGTSSFKKSFKVISNEQNVASNLHIISLGCSKYQQSEYNLNFAEKDANDVVDYFSKTDEFDEVFVTKFVNEDVTKTKIKELKTFVKKVNNNDVILLFIAGHGVLDADLNYYIASHDMDFTKPQEKGIPIDFFDDLLDNTKCLKKLMFIDACHSGEIDKSEVAIDTTSTAISDADMVFRSVGNAVKNVNDINSFELSKIAFADIRESNGSIVISSAGGGEFAMEGEEWSNGVFTYSLLKGLKSGEADLNQDKQIMISELHQYLIYNVNRITKGRQTPTSRVENLNNDFRIQ